MSTEREVLITQKAMAYDLIELIDSSKTYTGEEVQEIIRAYISGSET